MKEIERCEVCGADSLKEALNLGMQPMCNDLIPIGSEEIPRSYPLVILGCDTCFTFHQKFQVEKSLLFPSKYYYRAGLTADVLSGMEELVADILTLTGPLHDKQVLDIGCNDGSLLSIFRSYGANTFGIEPTEAFEEAKTRFHAGANRYFDSDTVRMYLSDNVKPDVITFTNVFAHIEDLDTLCRNLLPLIKQETKIVIENHYMGSVAKLDQFDTFYHEHPRTYSLKSFEFVAKKLGLVIERVSFPSRYNGNIRVMLGNGDPAEAPTINEHEDYLKIFDLPQKIERGKTYLRAKLSHLATMYGPLPAKAFPGRAAINVHCLGIDHQLIDVTYEKSGSPKIGHYVPGTKIEIRDEIELFKNRLDVPHLVNFAWHIREEIQRYMRSHGYRGEIIDAWLNC